MSIRCSACGEEVGIVVLSPSRSLAVVSVQPERGAGEVVILSGAMAIRVSTLLEMGLEIPDNIKLHKLHALHCKAKRVDSEPKDLFTKEIFWVIIVNDKALEPFRRAPRCEWCGMPARLGVLDPHHIIAKGMGGGGRIDHAWNLVALCRGCHGAAHSGRIRRERLFEIVSKRERVPVEQITCWLALIRRTPKDGQAPSTRDVGAVPDSGSGNAGRQKDDQLPTSFSSF